MTTLDYNLTVPLDYYQIDAYNINGRIQSRIVVLAEGTRHKWMYHGLPGVATIYAIKTKAMTTTLVKKIR